MKNSLKRKLSLLLAIVLAFTMMLPTGLLASAAEGEGEGEGEPEEPAIVALTPLEEDVTDKVDVSTVTSTASGFNGEGANNIFDNMPDTKFCGTSSPSEAAPLDFTWQMTEAVAVQAYAITSAADSSKYSGRDPKVWKFYGSEDGETWVELDARSGQGFGADGTTLLYTFDNTTAYTYYKYSVTANRGESIVQFSCIQLSTKKFDSDADTEAIAAAAAFDQKLEDLGELTNENYNGQETLDQVAALRAEYNALGTAVKDKVTKLDILIAAEKFISKIGAKDKCIAQINAIEATYNEYKDEAFGGDFDYHLNGKITYAYDLYNSLSDADKEAVRAAANYDVLAQARELMDSEYNDYFEVTVEGWNQPEKTTKTPWLMTADADAQIASQDAATDELKYQLSRQGYMLAPYASSTVTLTASWGDAMLIQFDAQPNDNVGNPWGHANRLWGSLCVPFAGTAFSLTGYFALNDNVTPISNAFYMDGKVYQQYLGMYRCYDYQAIAPISEENAAPSISTVTNYPGHDGATDITKNTFRRAYAEYNQSVKWEGKTLGIADANAVQTESGIVYQAFTGPNGTAYIVASAEMIALGDANDPQSIAFVMDEEIMAIIAALDTENNDFVAGLEITGAPLTAMEDGVQLFENGVITDGAFAEKNADTEYLYVIIDISSLPTTITASNYASAKAAIEEARAAYDALTANKDKVDNYSILETAEKALEKYETDLAAAAAVSKMIEDLPQDLTLEDEEQVKAARAAYDALTPEQKALVKGLNILVFSEGEIDDLKVENVENLLNAMPADEEITEADLAEKRVPVEAAKAAYDALSEDLQKQVNSKLVDAMNYKLQIVAAGGIEHFITKGDVDRDGKVTVSDVVELRKLIIAGTFDDIGDMDGDGNLTVSDVVELRAVIVAG